MHDDPDRSRNGRRRSAGRVAVTGGASGLGAAVVRAVRDRGGRPLVIDRQRVDDLEQAGSDRPRVDQVVVDLADGRAAERAIAGALGAEPLDGLVCAAGIDACGRFEDVDADRWEQVVAVDLLGVAGAIRAALPALRAGRGRAVTIASTLAARAVSDASAYCASKAGVVALSRVLAIELAPEVGVTCVVPGGMDTAFFDGRPAQYRPGPDAVMNDPAAVADAICFALDQPEGCELRELTICPAVESSWP